MPNSHSASQSARLGVLAMIACCVIWGLAPLYYGLLSHVPPTDILAHRTLWSLVFFGLVLTFNRRLPELRVAVSLTQIGWVALAALMISINWFLFITSVQIGRVTEASLGYYIFPLVSVIFGAVIFKERLASAQWAAVALAAFAVAILTVGLGVMPWISLALAISFGLYGVLKKQISTGPVISVTAEVLLLSPLAILWIVIFSDASVPDPATFVLLLISGPLTGLPLILFSYATKRVRLATVGLLQYINPTLQFLLALFILAEPMSIWHAIAFPLIWIALALYSFVALRQERAARRPSTSISTVGTG